MLRTTFHALLVANAACGLDAIGTSPEGSETTPDGETPGVGDDGATPPEQDADLDDGSSLSPEADADVLPGPDDASVEDAANPDGASPLYRENWFDLTNEPTTWTATWWKADTCRNKPGQILTNIGPKIIETSTRKEVLPAPAADRADSQEPLLEFPRDPSIWPDKKGVPGIAETVEPVGNGGPTNAFCARFTARLHLPPGTYTLQYEVGDSIVVYVNQKLIDGPKWFDSILNAGYGDQKSSTPIDVDAEDSQDVRIYYNNVNKDAFLKLRLEGPMPAP